MLTWFHESPHSALRSQLEVDGNNAVTDIVGIGPSKASELKGEYNIETIHDLVGYILHNGFPQRAPLPQEAQLALSIRIAKKIGIF